MIVRTSFLLYTKLIDALTYIPIHFEDTLMYVDPITIQTYDYATPIACENNPKNTIELDPDSDDQIFYNLGPEPKRKPPFTPSQTKTTIRPNTFTAQAAGIYSNAELDQFWNKTLFSKLSDSTLQLFGKTLSYSFISSNTPYYDENSLHENPIYYVMYWFARQTDKSYSSFYAYMVFRRLYCTIWISLLYFNSMWNIFFYSSFCTSNSYTHCQTLQNNFNSILS